MKRIIILVLLVILGALSAAELNAASEDPKVVYSEDVYSETEFQEVREFTEEFSKQFDNFPEGEINSGYKLYAMDPVHFPDLLLRMPHSCILQRRNGSDVTGRMHGSFPSERSTIVTFSILTVNGYWDLR